MNEVKCGNAFNSGSDHMQHQLIHTGEFCGDKECEKPSLPDTSLLNIKHLTLARKHTNIKDVVWTFLMWLILKEFILDRKTFKCKECRKAFSFDSELTQHQRLQMCEKSYKCKECGKVYSHKADLIGHQSNF